jgi:transposase
LCCTDFGGFRLRINLLKREASAYIKLRRIGYSINSIARAFGRSTSIVFRRLQMAIQHGILSRHDMRKIPNRIRQLCRARQWTQIIRFFPAWEQWVLGIGEKPP